jgi:hypothetical protein
MGGADPAGTIGSGRTPWVLLWCSAGYGLVQQRSVPVLGRVSPGLAEGPPRPVPVLPTLCMRREAPGTGGYIFSRVGVLVRARSASKARGWCRRAAAQGVRRAARCPAQRRVRPRSAPKVATGSRSRRRAAPGRTAAARAAARARRGLRWWPPPAGTARRTRRRRSAAAGRAAATTWRCRCPAGDVVLVVSLRSWVVRWWSWWFPPSARR